MSITVGSHARRVQTKCLTLKLLLRIRVNCIIKDRRTSSKIQLPQDMLVLTPLVLSATTALELPPIAVGAFITIDIYQLKSAIAQIFSRGGTRDKFLVVGINIYILQHIKCTRHQGSPGKLNVRLTGSHACKGLPLRYLRLLVLNSWVFEAFVLILKS